MAASKEFVAKQRRRRMSQPGKRCNILRTLSGASMHKSNGMCSIAMSRAPLASCPFRKAMRLTIAMMMRWTSLGVGTNFLSSDYWHHQHA